MKLVPLLRFWERRQREEDDFLDELPEQALQFPTEEEAESPAEEDAEDEREEEGEMKEEEETVDEGESAGGPGGQDDLLKVFLAAEEEYADTQALATEVEDVPAAELLAELREVADTLNLPSARQNAR